MREQTDEMKGTSNRVIVDWRASPRGAELKPAIVIKDSMKAEVARWNFERGWVSKWTGAELDAGSNEVATEKVVITHEGLHRA